MQITKAANITIMKFVLSLITLLPAAVFGSSSNKDRLLATDTFHVQYLLSDGIVGHTLPVHWIHDWGEYTSGSDANDVNKIVTFDITPLPTGEVKCPGGADDAYDPEVPGVSHGAVSTTRADTIFTSSTTLSFVATNDEQTEQTFQFCARAGLRDTLEATGDLVGFRETVVTVVFTLDGAFESLTYSLTNADPTNPLDKDDVVTVETTICNPGAAIDQLQQPACLLVEPDKDGWIVTSLRNVEVLSVDAGDMGYIIDGDGVQVASNGQAEMTPSGDGVQLNWLFDARFSTKDGTHATVRGTAVIESSRRRLGAKGRGLTETKESGFESTIEVEPVGDDSGAFEITVTSFVLVSGAGAALLL